MMDNKQLPMKIEKVLWVLGLLGALSGAFLMWNGNLLNEDSVSLVKTIGIIGIITIGAAKATMRRERK